MVDGEYRHFELTTEPDGVLKGFSLLLRLFLCWQEEMLPFFNHQTGAYLRNLPEAEAALQEEQAARERAEIRVRQLEEELRRRQ